MEERKGTSTIRRCDPSSSRDVRTTKVLAVARAAGGGCARYSESKLRRDDSPNPSQQDTNSGTLQFGGGINVRTWSWLGFRGEIRDVHTGARRFSISTPGRPVQNVVASAVYRWSFDPALSEGLF